MKFNIESFTRVTEFYVAVIDESIGEFNKGDIINVDINRNDIDSCKKSKTILVDITPNSEAFNLVNVKVSDIYKITKVNSQTCECI